jgi:hypothetical protein
MAKKQKDKKINNGGHNNTQTDNIMAKKQKDKKINNGRHNNTQTNRQYNAKSLHIPTINMTRIKTT